MDFGAVIERAKAEAKRRLGKAASRCATELKLTVSVPAPRKVSKKTGRPYATTPATGSRRNGVWTGAPPRKLSGRGRAGIAWQFADGGRSAVVGENVWYMPYWESHGHPWVKPTLDRIRGDLNDILRGG